MSRSMRLAPCVVLVLTIGLAAAGACFAANDQTLLNGDLKQGSAGLPADWRISGWLQGPDAVTFGWSPGEVRIFNLKPDDSQWVQSLTLAPGWYYMSVEIRTEDVAAQGTGANISILEDGMVSLDLHGTNPWRTVGIYLKVTKPDTKVDLSLRLGGFASLITGKAYFRNVSVTKVDAPPTGGSDLRVYDLEAIRHPEAAAESSGPLPATAPSSVLAIEIIAVLGLLALFGARLLRRVRSPGGAAPAKPPPESAEADADRPKPRDA